MFEFVQLVGFHWLMDYEKNISTKDTSDIQLFLGDYQWSSS